LGLVYYNNEQNFYQEFLCFLFICVTFEILMGHTLQRIEQIFYTQAITTVIALF